MRRIDKDADRRSGSKQSSKLIQNANVSHTVDYYRSRGAASSTSNHAIAKLLRFVTDKGSTQFLKPLAL
jgi:hypothetical protein